MLRLIRATSLRPAKAGFREDRPAYARLAAVLGLCLVTGLVATPAGAQHRDTTGELRVRQLLIRGLTRMYVEDYEGASSIFEQALRLAPNDPALLASITSTRMAGSDIAAASFYLNRALDAHPDRTELWHLSAEFHLVTGDMESLIEDRRRLSEISPGSARNLVELVELLARLNRFDEAIELLEDADSRITGSRILLSVRADLLEKLGRMNAYEAALGRMIELDPGDTASRLRLGSSMVRRGALEDAVKVFEAVARDDPFNDDALAALRAVRDSLGVPHDMLQPLSVDNSERVRDRADETAAISSRADIHLREGRFAEAAGLYARLVQMDPKRLAAWVAGIDAYTKAADTENALEMARSGLLLFPGYVPILLAEARALVESGQIERALEQIRMLLTGRLSEADQQQVRSLQRRIEAM